MNARSRLATLEAGAASQEEKDFTGMTSTRFAAPGHNNSQTVARLGLSNGQQVGPSKTLTVQQGDTITFTSYAWLTAAVAAGTSKSTTQAARSTSVVVLAAPLSAPAVPPLPPGSMEGSASPNPLGQVRLGVSFGLGAGSPTSGPVTNGSGSGFPGVARLHYIIKDQDGAVKLDDYQTANPAAPGTWQQLQVGLRLQQGGTVELSVETDGALGPDVFFDDTEVKLTASTIVQEQHQYAYGAPMLGLNYTVGSKNYRHGYQGQFAEKDEETGLDAFELRLYDSRTGRWTAPDPAGQFASPYVGMGNNPVSSVDPDGGLSFAWLVGGAEQWGLLHNIGTSLAAAGSAIGRGAVASGPLLLQAGVGTAFTAVRALRQGSQGQVTNIGTLYLKGDEEKAYRDMWSNSFNKDGSVFKENSAWITDKGILVMPNYKNEGARSHNDYYKIYDDGKYGYMNVNGQRLNILGHVHTHPNGYTEKPSLNESKDADDYRMTRGHNGMSIFIISPKSIYKGQVINGNPTPRRLGSREDLIKGKVSLYKDL